jgi:DNA-binding NarL/FixJ family response regulator
MPLLNGIDALRQIKRTAPTTRVMMLTMHGDMAYLAEAFRAGASGYVVKHSAATELLQAIREVLKGKVYVSPQLSKDLPNVLGQPPDRRVKGELTGRQREIVQLVAEGCSNKEIASILNISVKTVEFHKSRLMGELGINTTAGLTKFAIDHGLIGS